MEYNRYPEHTHIPTLKAPVFLGTGSATKVMSFTSFTTLWKCAPRENTGVSCREMHVHITVTIHNGRQLTWPICRWGGCGRSIRSGCGISIHGRKSGTIFGSELTGSCNEMGGREREGGW